MLHSQSGCEFLPLFLCLPLSASLQLCCRFQACASPLCYRYAGFHHKAGAGFQGNRKGQYISNKRKGEQKQTKGSLSEIL
jgi:hypothetical protein